MGPRVGRSRSAVTKSRKATTADAVTTPASPRPTSIKYAASSPRAIEAPISSSQKISPRNLVVEGGYANRLRVDHLVQCLDIQTRRTRLRGGVERFAGERPETPLKPFLLLGGGELLGAARHVLGEADRALGVIDQQLERAAAYRLRQRLRPQIGRPDRVRLLDDRRAAILVAREREREAEGEDQANDPEHRRLQHPERLSERLREVMHAAPDERSERGRAQDEPEHEQPELHGG